MCATYSSFLSAAIAEIGVDRQVVIHQWPLRIRQTVVTVESLAYHISLMVQWLLDD